MTNMLGKPRLIIPNRLAAPSAHFSARVTPPRPTISWPTRRYSGVSSASKPGAVDDAVDLVLLPVDHRSLLGDALDPARAVDQGDVGAVEGRQVLVVEARALAQVAVVRLEDLGRGRIGHQLLDPVAGAPP